MTRIECVRVLDKDKENNGPQRDEEREGEGGLKKNLSLSPSCCISVFRRERRGEGGGEHRDQAQTWNIIIGQLDCR